VKGVAESTTTFQKLNESADAAKVIEWEEQERLAQQRCTINPKAMDIYEVQLCRGMWPYLIIFITHSQLAPTQKEQEQQLLEANGWHVGPARLRGTATWLAEDLSIEEAQLTLQMDLRRLGRHPTESQRLNIACRQERLQGDIDWWLAQGLRFLDDRIGDSNIQVMENELFMLEEDQMDETAEEFRLFKPDKMVLPMPSILGPEWCAELGTDDMIQHKLALQEGQANDALHNIRVHLADKAVTYLSYHHQNGKVPSHVHQSLGSSAWQ
jgi:hypothetical protein